MNVTSVDFTGGREQPAPVFTRARVVLGLLLLVYLALAGRLVHLQYVEHPALAKVCAAQSDARLQWRDWRGPIKDAIGRVIAESIPVQSCAIDPKTLEERGARLDEAVGRLAEILRLTPAELQRIYKEAGRTHVRFDWLPPHLSDAEADAVKTALAPRVGSADSLDAEGMLALARSTNLTVGEIDKILHEARREKERFIWVRRHLSDEQCRSLDDLKAPVEGKTCALDLAAANRAGGTDAILGRIAETLRLSPKEIRRLCAAVADAKGPQAWIDRNLGRDEYAALKNAMIPGVYFPREEGAVPGLLRVPEFDRVYPQGALAGQCIGSTDIDGRGIEGVEKICDAFLQGVPGARRVERDAGGRRLVGDGAAADPSRYGLSAELTLDSAVQMIAEEELAKVAEEYKPIKNACAVVMDPASGDILALANWPSCDPNHPDAGGAHRLNTAIASIYEPGSTFKPFVFGAAFEKGLINLQSEFHCENGSWTMGNGRVLHDVHGYGLLTAEYVLVKSSNIGIAKIAALLGPSSLHDAVRLFGFGEKTGVVFPGEIPGKVRPFREWTSYSMGSVPMGQEIAVTPMQLVTAYSAIANGGRLLKPRIVRAIRDAEGNESYSFSVAERRRIFQPKTTEVLRAILAKVVTEGTGKRALMPEYPIGGKTGTANLPVNTEEYRAGMRGYSKSRYVSSFVGIVPIDAPRLVVMVAVREPHGANYGGTVAAPVVREISRRTLQYLGVPPRNATPLGPDGKPLAPTDGDTHRDTADVAE